MQHVYMTVLHNIDPGARLQLPSERDEALTRTVLGARHVTVLCTTLRQREHVDDIDTISEWSSRATISEHIAAGNPPQSVVPSIVSVIASSLAAVLCSILCYSNAFVPDKGMTSGKHMTMHSTNRACSLPECGTLSVQLAKPVVLLA